MSHQDPYRAPSSALPPGGAEDPRSKWTRISFHVGQGLVGASLLFTGFLMFLFWRGQPDPHGYAFVVCAGLFGLFALPIGAIGIAAMVTCRRKAA